MSLRPYQLRAVELLRASYRSGHRAPCLQLPTAAGKTIIAAEIIRGSVARGNPVLFLADRTELIAQTARKLALVGLDDVRVIQASEVTGSPTSPVTVASVQTIRMPRWESQLPAARLVIADEAHGFMAGSYSYLLSCYPGARLLGLTATPARRDGRPLGDVFDDLVAPTSVRELTDDGYLCPSFTWAGPGDLKPGELAMTPLEAYQQFGQGDLAAVYCRDRAHANAEQAAFAGVGIPAAVVDGTLSPARRQATIAAWERGDIRVVTSVGCLTTGFDLPGLAVAIVARRFSHPTLWLQICGRVLRVHPGKKLARIIDLCGSSRLPDFGPPDLDRVYSLTGKPITTVARDSFGQCCECGGMYRSGPRTCVHCGAELPVRAIALPKSTGAGVTALTGAAPKREFVVRMLSKRAGLCAECGGTIDRGQPILWATLAGRAKHQDCRAAA